MQGFKQWLEGSFATDDKTSEQPGIAVRGGTIGHMKIKNPPNGVPTPSNSSPFALRDRIVKKGNVDPNAVPNVAPVGKNQGIRR